MGEWKKYSLADIYDFSSGLSKPREEFGFGYDFLSFKDVFDNYFLPKKLSNLVNSTEKERERCSVKRGDVFLTRTSETDDDLGMSSVALKEYPNATFNGFTKRLRPKNNEFILPEFSGFYFRSNHFRAIVTSMASITTRASLNNQMLGSININIPPLPEQKAIAAALSSLDDKIDLLQRQNKTLEALAETLFRQWFIEQAQDDWEECELAQFAENGRDSIKPKQILSDEIYVGLEHISRKNIALNKSGYGNEVTSNKYRFEKGDILFGKLRPYFHKVCFAPFSGICSTDILVIRPKKPEYFSFCLFAFYQAAVVEYANLGSGGTRMPRTNWKSLSQYTIAKLPESRIIEFNNLVLPFIKRIERNLNKIHTLKKLRDTLLPKLMSGEVRINM